VGDQVPQRSAQGLSAHGHHACDRLFIGLLGAAYINLAFVGLSGWLTEWFSLEQDPSVWFSFVLSMVWLVWVMRKG